MSEQTQTFPPHVMTWDGRPRRVGVEIEYGGLEADAAAEEIAGLFGGEIVRDDKYRRLVKDTSIGDFEVELDSQYAHPDEAGGKPGGLLRQLRQMIAPTVGDVVKHVLPFEVVCPPVTIDRLGEIDTLIARLRARRASGTGESPIAAFGLQLNPELMSLETPCLTWHLQAYLLLSPWLRQDIGIDLTRRMAAFVDKFPDAYARHVTAPGYDPGVRDLIDDYLHFNPTRNRELDLLPLFGFIDEARVRAAVPDPRIKTRPTFHYRLPDSRVDDPDWGGVREEWSRWVRVERLAVAGSLREEACAELHHFLSKGGTCDDWAARSGHFAGRLT